MKLSRKGFTLVEVTVAVIIGAVVIYGLAQTMRLVFRQNTVTRANTESSRAGLEIDRTLSGDLRDAGLGLIAAPNVGGINILNGVTTDTLILLKAASGTNPQIKVSSHPCPAGPAAPCLLLQGAASGIGVDSLIMVGAPGTGARLLQVTAVQGGISLACEQDCGRFIAQAVTNTDGGPTSSGTYDDLSGHVITTGAGVVGAVVAGTCASAGYDPPVHADGSRCDAVLKQDVAYALAAGMISQSGMSNYSAANCTDGNTATICWQTDASGPGAYVQIDLGSAVALTTLGLYTNVGGGSPAYPGLYDIQYSDGGAWTTVRSDFAPRVGWSNAEWPVQGAHRYWRFLLKNSPGAGSWQIEEIQAGVGQSTAVGETPLPIDASATYTAVTYLDRTNMLGFPQIPSVAMHSGTRSYPLVIAARVQAIRYYLDTTYVRPSVVRNEQLKLDGSWGVKAPVIPDVTSFTVDVRHSGSDDSEANYSRGIGITPVMLSQSGGNSNYIRTDVPPNVSGAKVWTPGFTYIKSFSTVTAVRVKYTATVRKKNPATNAFITVPANFATIIATPNITGGGAVVP